METINVGDVFHKLKVIDIFYKKCTNRNRLYATCKCECGNKVDIRVDKLSKGHKINCGKCSLNDFEIIGDYVKGFTRKNEIFYFDIEDFDKVRNKTWYITTQGYVATHYNKDILLMHRLIKNISNGDPHVVDHINGSDSRNDNRKLNLRIVTRSENNYNRKIQCSNTSGTTGVSYDKRHKRWIAQIWYEKKYKRLGSFKYKKDAIVARKSAETKYFGDYSYDNSRITKDNTNYIQV